MTRLRWMQLTSLLCVAATFLLLPLVAGAIRQDRASLLLNPDAAEFRAQAPERVIVRLESSAGTIDIEVVRRRAPGGADRFVAKGGNAWLLREFPRLDFIRRAIVLEP